MYVVVLGVFAHFLAWIGVVCWCHHPLGATPSMLQVPRIWRELLGMALRSAKGLPSFGFSMARSKRTSPFSEQDATSVRAVDEVYAKCVLLMRKHPLAYTKWQFDSVRALYDEVRVLAIMHETFQRMMHDHQEQVFRQARAKQEWQTPQEDRAPRSNWRAVLELATAEADVPTIKRAYRRLAAQAHPDRGGSNEQMARLNLAMDEARKELQFV